MNLLIRQRGEPSVLPGPTGADRHARWRGVCQLFFLIFALGLPAAGQTVDTYGDLLDRQLALKPEAPGAAQLDPEKMTAADWRAYDLETAIKREAQKKTQEPLVDAPPPDHNGLA